MGSGKRMKLVEIAHFTDDVGSMADFYRRLLAAEPVAQSAEMAIFLIGDTKLFIHKTYAPVDEDLPPEDHTAYAVSDVDGHCLALTEAGLQIERSPKDYYWGRSAYLRDPDGQLIEIIQSA